LVQTHLPVKEKIREWKGREGKRREEKKREEIMIKKKKIKEKRKQMKRKEKVKKKLPTHCHDRYKTCVRATESFARTKLGIIAIPVRITESAPSHPFLNIHFNFILYTPDQPNTRI